MTNILVNSWLQNYIKAKDIDKVAETIRPYIKCEGDNF